MACEFILSSGNMAHTLLTTGRFGKARHLVEKVAKARSNDAAKRTLEELVSARERRIHEEEVAGCENEKGGDSGVSFQTVSPPRSPRTLHTAVVLPD